MAVLGIDTSNYTTSVAVYLPSESKVISKRKLLDVNEGQKGLRQSDAVFQHTKNIPLVANLALTEINEEITAVGVSEKPRDTEDSYMPCFLAGISAASLTSAALKCDLYHFSHQRGHIAAAVYSVDRLDLLNKEFIAFHISGGTTEMLHIVPDNELIIKCIPIGVTLDLNAGQVIDRVGVMLGLKFPCGAELEKLATCGKLTKKYKPVLKEGNCCLSGVENLCSDMLKKGESKNDVARFCLDAVTKTIVKMTEYGIDNYGNLPIVYAGGVMSDSIIRNEIEAKFNCVFSKPEFSCDNAAGIAVLTAIKKGYIVL